MEFGLIGLVLVGLMFSIALFIDARKAKQKKNKESDLNIEWYGDQIYMKEKEYDYLQDDFRSELIDREKYVEEKGKTNVRNGGSDSCTN